MTGLAVEAGMTVPGRPRRRSGPEERKPGRHLIGLVVGLGMLGAAASCSMPAGTVGESPRADAAAPAPAPSGALSPADDASIVHVLNRIGYGPRPGDVARVRATGLETYIERQLDPERYGLPGADGQLSTLRSLRASIAELHREYPQLDAATRARLEAGQMTPEAYRQLVPAERRPARILVELQAAHMVRAVGSERQLEEIMVDFWLNHFNVYAQKGQVRWYVTAFERDVLRPHALGKFRDLVLATARHPAMLFYLDNWLSTRSDFVIRAGPQKGRKAGLNENYARELMELHTLGVDGGYTQEDVREVARAFTGWTIERPQQEARFVFRSVTHDPGNKVVLGQPLVGWGGEAEGVQVIDRLTRHPSTARFLATKLVRRFVADDPPAGLVARVADVYRVTDGDVRAMLRTIFAAPEFLAPETRQAKTKKPSEFVASAVRALGGTVDIRGGSELAGASARMGEALYEAQPPTGYPDRSDAWVSAGALLARMNFALGLASRRIPGITVDPDALVTDVDRRVPSAVLDRLVAAILPQQVSPETRAVLEAQLGTPEITRLTSDDRTPADTDVAKLVALVVGSPEFQRR